MCFVPFLLLWLHDNEILFKLTFEWQIKKFNYIQCKCVVHFLHSVPTVHITTRLTKDLVNDPFTMFLIFCNHTIQSYFNFIRNFELRLFASTCIKHWVVNDQVSFRNQILQIIYNFSSLAPLWLIICRTTWSISPLWSSWEHWMIIFASKTVCM